MFTYIILSFTKYAAYYIVNAKGRIFKTASLSVKFNDSTMNSSKAKHLICYNIM